MTPSWASIVCSYSASVIWSITCTGTQAHSQLVWLGKSQGKEACIACMVVSRLAPNDGMSNCQQKLAMHRVAAGMLMQSFEAIKIAGARRMSLS